MDVKQFKLYAMFFLISLDETTSQFVWLLPIMHTFFPYENMHPVYTQRRPKFVILTAEMFFPSRQFAVSSTECNCLHLVIIDRKGRNITACWNLSGRGHIVISLDLAYLVPGSIPLFCTCTVTYPSLCHRILSSHPSLMRLFCCLWWVTWLWKFSNMTKIKIKVDILLFTCSVHMYPTSLF